MNEQKKGEMIRDMEKIVDDCIERHGLSRKSRNNKHLTIGQGMNEKQMKFI